MSIFSWLANKFTKVIIVGKSELSNPTQCNRKFDGDGYDEYMVLQILNKNGTMRASAIDMMFHSGGRRANDLYHRGLVDNFGTKTVFKYEINSKGYDLLLQLEKKYETGKTHS